MLAIETSVPLFAKNLPYSAKRYTKFCEKLFLLQEHSRLFFKFYVRSYIRTFLSFRMYYRILTTPRIFLYRGKRIVGPGGPAQFAKQYYQFLRSNFTKICEAILPKIAKQYYQNLRSNITKICEARIQKFAKQIIPFGPCRFASLPLLTYIVPTKNPWKEVPAE